MTIEEVDRDIAATRLGDPFTRTAHGQPTGAICFIVFRMTVLRDDHQATNYRQKPFTLS